MSTMTVKATQVNSKTLFTDINEMAIDFHDSVCKMLDRYHNSGNSFFIGSSAARYQRNEAFEVANTMVSHFEMIMEDFVEQNKVRVYDVIHDKHSMDNPSGPQIITVKYRQRDCINWTFLTYTFSKNR